MVLRPFTEFSIQRCFSAPNFVPHILKYFGVPHFGGLDHQFAQRLCVEVLLLDPITNSKMVKSRHSRKWKSRGKGKSERGGFSMAGPSSSVVDYHGPTKVPKGIDNLDTYMMAFSVMLGLSSNAGGVIATEYDNGMAAYAGWATAAANWDEYRVCSVEVEYFPFNRYSKTTTTCVPILGVVDHDSVGVLTSSLSALQYASVRILSLEDPWTDRRDYPGSRCPSIKMRSSGVEEMSFGTTATTSASRAIKLYGTGLSNSVQYGNILVTAMVQFRGRI